MSGAAMEVEDLTAGYGEAMVLRDLSLRVEAGEVVAVLGKNGMGKSTLLKTVMGLLPAQSGRIRLLGEDVTGRPPVKAMITAMEKEA
jgi:branched-chain amino acid transport system ATP-binding protein